MILNTHVQSVIFSFNAEGVSVDREVNAGHAWNAAAGDGVESYRKM